MARENESRPSPESILADHLASLGPGEPPDLDQLCARHPEHARALRRLWSVDQKLRRALPEQTESILRPQGIPAAAPETEPERSRSVRSGEVLGDFRLVQPLGQGGMGQVWLAEQLSLRRNVALKLVRPEKINERTLAFFEREARAGGRLNHPGIVTVYGHGSADGTAWIAMELVEGAWTLRDSLDEMLKLEELPRGYYARVASFVASMADAMAAAHRSRVVHRDLKPQNVLVTSDDEPKLTDFGLAKITDESALSATGDLAGTYYYMSPEQVLAKRGGIDHRTDVFSLGVVMYEMLTLRRPFEGDTTHQVAEQILDVDPPSPRSVRSRVPDDQAVICAKCLEKDRDRRYQDMAELAADLRRHLAGEPILAKPPSAWFRLVKWARRRPAASVALAGGSVAFVVIAVLLAAYVRANDDLARTAERERERVQDVLRLSALQDLEDLLVEADRLWPAHPPNVAAYREWIRRGSELVDDLPQHRSSRAELRAELASAGPGHQTLWWDAQLGKLIAGLEELQTGLLARDVIVPGYGWSVPKRLALAERLLAGEAPGSDWHARWEEASADIRADPRYVGLRIAAQPGLVPIGRDPASGLWEFWHVASGAEPERSAGGRLRLAEATGVVLVLLPGGSFWMGAQSADAAGRNYDPRALTEEGPVRQEVVAAFLLSKYELTQAQWLRFAGSNPSGFRPPDLARSLNHPVEHVTWNHAMAVLARMELTLPSEAQWEYACRAGASTPWWTGRDPRSLLERSAGRLAFHKSDDPALFADAPEYEDSHTVVGSHAANGFGLHDVHGNVFEWCADDFFTRTARAPGPGAAPYPACRGGAYTSAPRNARSSFRDKAVPSYHAGHIGLRPALAVRAAGGR